MNSAKCVLLLQHRPANHFPTNCDKVTLLPLPLLLLDTKTRRGEKEALTAASGDTNQDVCVQKFASVLSCARVFCGLTRELRKKPLSPVSVLLLVNTSHWNWDTARHCGLFKAAIHCEEEEEERGSSQLLYMAGHFSRSTRPYRRFL